MFTIDELKEEIKTLISELPYNEFITPIIESALKKLVLLLEVKELRKQHDRLLQRDRLLKDSPKK